MASSFTPRPAQDAILAYRGGTMGVSAVPGSGKTWTLSLLAAELIRSGCLSDDQEILVVTLVNSAVQNFSHRINLFLDDFGLIPSLGYRVRTLHGLAHDIVKERPELAGLDNGFQIIDDRESTRIREDAVISEFHKTPSLLDGYFIPDLSESRLSRLHDKQIPTLLNQISLQFIRTAKNLHLSPEELTSRLAERKTYSSLIRFGIDVYKEYQKNLSFRGAVDFDDLIIKAYQILIHDNALLSRLQGTWPYILEDESQDSSLLQQKILSLLATQAGSLNWVRVGDPNQAIYESFTTADPRLLNEFIQEADFSYNLPNSGRNTLGIINLANYLVQWCINDHPTESARGALYPNFIQPTPPGDYQPNPQGRPGQIHLYEKEMDPDEELYLLAKSITNWLAEHQDSTSAILAPRNERGKRMASILREDFGVEPVELLNSTLATRKTIGSLVKILSYLIDPSSSKKLASAFLVYHRDKRSDPSLWEDLSSLSDLISSIQNPELYLSPGPGTDFLNSLQDQFHHLRVYLTEFKSIVKKWQDAAQLPIDQLILTLALEIFKDPQELALSHKLASYEKQLSIAHPEWGLPAFLDELRSLARNERRFFASGDDHQFNPEDHKGKVVVTTAHKSKGLEWDRVYLMSANTYNFPSGAEDDTYISERWFIRDSLNLPAETLSQLEVLADPNKTFLDEGLSSKLAREEYVRERLRLLYVAITRAKKELIITWNTGRSGKSGPSIAFSALVEYLKNKGVL